MTPDSLLDLLKEGKIMLETLVSSKIRRTLLRQLLTHPSRRFYLSGLARELDLTISPLRRELKRFENLGLLKSLKEANTVFYTVEQSSPVFTQLSQVWGQAIGVSEEISRSEISQSENTTGPERDQSPASKTALSPAPLSPAMLLGGAQLPDQGVNARTERTSTEISLRLPIGQTGEISHSEGITGSPSSEARPHNIPRPGPRYVIGATHRSYSSTKRRAVRPRLAFSSTTAMAALSLSLMAVVGSGIVTYLVVTHQRVLALTQAASTSSPQLTMVEQGVATTMAGGEQEPPIASGKMRSGHWRLSQGAITSFSPSPGKESY